jgi:hypothetical protein
MSVLKRAQTELISSGTSMTINKPTGTAEGDLMVLFIGEGGGTHDVITPASGWNRVFGKKDDDAGGGAWQSCFTKTAGASEPSNYTFSFSASGSHKGFMVSYYDDGGVSGFWAFKGAGITEDRVTAITSAQLVGPGLYITSFLSDDDDAVNSTDSSVPSLWFNDSSFSMQIYGGVTTNTSETTTVNWAGGSDDKYTISLMCEFVEGTETAPSDLAYRASTSAQQDFTSNLFGSTTVTLNKPSGVVEGDLMVMNILLNNSSGSITSTPSGWSVVYDATNLEDSNGFGAMQGGQYYKVAGASEPSTYSFVIRYFNANSAIILSGIFSIDTYYHSSSVASWTLYGKSFFGRENDAVYTDIEALPVGGNVLYTVAFGVQTNASYTDDVPVTQRTSYTGGGDDSKGMHLTYGGALGQGYLRSKISGPIDDSRITAAAFLSTATPTPEGALFKIKIGSTAITAIYKDIEAMHVATSSVWKEVLSAQIAVSDGAGGLVWKELKVTD